MLIVDKGHTGSKQHYRVKATLHGYFLDAGVGNLTVKQRYQAVITLRN